MKKEVARYIQLICHEIDETNECILNYIPCEACTYNGHLNDLDCPCYKQASNDLKEVWRSKLDE